MMGKKKLGEIRTHLRRELEKFGRNAGKAIDRLIERTRSGTAPDEREIEALRILRAALERRARPARKKARRMKPGA